MNKTKQNKTTKLKKKGQIEKPSLDFFPSVLISYQLAEFTSMYHHSLRQDVFIKEEYHYLNVSKVGTFTVYNSLDCTFECLGNPSCLSFNLAAYKGADEKVLCELLGSEKYSNPKQFKSNNNSHHFSIKVTLTTCLFIVNIYTMHVHEPNLQ